MALPGLYERRVFPNALVGMYAGLHRPSGLVRISFEVARAAILNGLERETRGFKVTCQMLEGGRARVSVELTSVGYVELFGVVASDLVTAALPSTSGAHAIAAVRARLDHWERFMRGVDPGGLSIEAQIGLLGELSFLRTLLAAEFPSHLVVGTWLGPSGSAQDFAWSGRTLEVKATLQAQRSLVPISNARQLDETAVLGIRMCHFVFAQTVGGGSSLPEMVTSISAQLTDEVNEQFLDLLLQAGYHESQRALYEGARFVEFKRSYFHVKENFPRIRECDLLAGVQNVKYQVEVTRLSPFACTESEVIDYLAGVSL